MLDMPTFRYHPDPVATGSAAPASDLCDLCDRPAGLKYLGSVYGRQAEILRLRCIGDGTAARRLAVADGRPAELPDAIASLRAELIELGVEPVEADEQLRWMRRDGDITGYLFRCLHCGAHLAYSDAS